MYPLESSCKRLLVIVEIVMVDSGEREVSSLNKYNSALDNTNIVLEISSERFVHSTVIIPEAEMDISHQHQLIVPPILEDYVSQVHAIELC